MKLKYKRIYDTIYFVDVIDHTKCGCSMDIHNLMEDEIRFMMPDLLVVFPMLMYWNE